mgnify:CR=1 FL=1
MIATHVNEAQLKIAFSENHGCDVCQYFEVLASLSLQHGIPVGKSLMLQLEGSGWYEWTTMTTAFWTIQINFYWPQHNIFCLVHM